MFDQKLIVETPNGAEELNVVSVLLVAFVMGLLATAALHALLLAVPSGPTFFAWIGTLVFLLSLVLIASFDVTTENELLLALLHLVVYASIVPVLSGMVPRFATRLR